MTPTPPAGTWRARASWTHWPLLGVCFTIGFAAFRVAVRPVLPRPSVPEFDEKRDLFLAHAAETDAVFIGSSRVFHQFIPSQFDEAMRAAGEPTHSLNLGVDGMVAPESFFAAEDFLSLHPRLRWVFIELQPIQPRFPKHYDGTVRAWWWHDWKSALLVVRASLREPYRAERTRFQTLLAHAGLLLTYYVRPGCFAEVFSARRQERRAQTNPAPREIGDAGFLPMTGPRMTGEATSNYLRGVSAYRAAPASNLPTELIERLRQVAASVRGAGATPVFVITPGIGPKEKIFDLRAQGIDCDLLALNDPAAFPSLYDPAMLVNQSHLNEAGAREFTKLLAERFAALLRASSSASIGASPSHP